MSVLKSGNLLTITSAVEAGYKYVHVVQKVTITADEEIISNVITESESTKTLPGDGYFIVSEIKLRTDSGNWLYISGDTVYDNGIEVAIEDLLLETGLTRTDTDIVNTYTLSTYYSDLLKANFTKYLCGCACMSKYDKLTQDSLVMGMELIDLLIVDQKYYEVQRVIEKLSTCHNLVTSNCDCNG